MPYMKNGKRDYKTEYKKYGSRTDVRKRRAANNRARYKMIKAGKASVGDGKDVAHKDNNSSNNSMSNLKSQKRSTNRSVPRTKNGHRKKR